MNLLVPVFSMHIISLTVTYENIQYHKRLHIYQKDQLIEINGSFTWGNQRILIKQLQWAVERFVVYWLSFFFAGLSVDPCKQPFSVRGSDVFRFVGTWSLSGCSKFSMLNARTEPLFSFKKNCTVTSYRILRHMHGVLNAVEKITNYTV